MCDGIFGDLFDLNHDGELDAFERGAELGFLHSMLEELDAEERRRALEDAGVDFDDFDF